MWQLAVLIVTAYAADFDSLKWSEGNHPSVRKSIKGPVAEEFQEGLRASVDVHSRQKRMIHGTDYQTPSSVPKYLVRIVRKNHGSSTKLTWCTGTIIAPGFVLTAAWCVYDQPDQKWRKSVIPLFELKLIAGDWNMTKDESNSEQIRDPIQYHIHPQYKYSPVRSNLEYDFALIQVKTNFTYNERVGEIEIWNEDMPVAPSLGQFIQLKMSGFGEAKTGADPNSNSMWATNEGEQYFPRYQYYAWRSEGSENCKRNWYWKISMQNWNDGGDPDPGYLLPQSDRGKVCFFTGILKEVPYQIGAGDWGAPITYFNQTANKEYLMMYAPYESLVRDFRQNVVRGEGDMDFRWAAKAGYYQSFTTPTLTKIASDYFSELSANSTTQTETISLDLSDRGLFGLSDNEFTTYDSTRMDQGAGQNMDYHPWLYIKEYTFFLTVDNDTHLAYSNESFVNVDIHYQPDTQITTNTTIYVRDGTGGGAVLHHFSGKAETTFSVNGISENMTIEVILANYEWTIRSLTLAPINITVTYSASEEKASSTGASCATGYLECEDKSFCVLPSSVCDLNYDCLDGRDETIWCLGSSCKSSEYRCSTGECIPSWRLCDSKCDCTDKVACEDERTCIQANFNETIANELLLERNTTESGAETFGFSFGMLVANFLIVAMLL